MKTEIHKCIIKHIRTTVDFRLTYKVFFPGTPLKALSTKNWSRSKRVYSVLHILSVTQTLYRGMFFPKRPRKLILSVMYEFQKKIIKCWLTDRLDAVGVFVTLCSIRAEIHIRANVARVCLLAYTMICFYIHERQKKLKHEKSSGLQWKWLVSLSLLSDKIIWTLK